MTATETETAVKERPIIMSGEMIRAILDGRKSMTRRVVKPMPFIDYPTGFRLQQEYKLDHHPKCSFVQAGMLCDCQAIYEPWKAERIEACPYGKPGGRLWLRETWAIADIYDKDSGNEGQMPFELGKTTRGISIWYKAGGEKAYKASVRGRWRSPIYMPRAASRITLEVTGVRVERVNQISEADCIAEGISYWQDNVGPCFGLIPGKATNRTGYAAFARLWNTINQKRGYGWDQNPFVWCISFKVVQP